MPTLSSILGARATQLGSLELGEIGAGAGAISASLPVTISLQATLNVVYMLAGALVITPTLAFNPAQQLIGGLPVTVRLTATLGFVVPLTASFRVSNFFWYTQNGVWDASIVQFLVPRTSPRPSVPIAYIRRIYQPTTGAVPYANSGYTGSLPGS